MTKDVKVILTAPVHLLSDAHAAFSYAYHNSSFQHGFAVILRDGREWSVKQNKAGFSVQLVHGPA